MGKIILLIKSFLIDQTRPRWLRFGSILVFILIIWVLVIISTTKQEVNNSIIPESVFPTSGDSGLSSGDNIQNEKIQALTEKSKSEAISSTENIESEIEKEASLLADNSQESNTKLKTPFSLLVKPKHEILSLNDDNSGNVWITHRGGLLFYNSKSKDLKTILNSQIFDRDFNDDMPEISASEIINEDNIYVGFNNGLLISYKNKHWQIESAAEDNFRTPITVIKQYSGRIFVGGKAIYYFDEIYNRFVGVPNLRNDYLSAISISKKNTLLVSSTHGLWEHNYSDNSWNLIWKLSPADSIIKVIYPISESEILLGTGNGIIKISASGVVTDRIFQGNIITSISKNKTGNIIVGTKDSGIKYYNGENWLSVKSDEGFYNYISGASFDAFGNLIIATTIDGIYSADEIEAANWLKSFLDKSNIKDAPEEFSNLCQAANIRLSGIQNSKDISIEKLDGNIHVFIKGIQECPRGLGYRRKDGFILLVSGWQATFYAGGVRTDIQIPQAYKIDQAKYVILDSKNRIWFSLPDNGLLKYEDKMWSVIGQEESLSNNPISSFIEDHSRALWFSSRPSVNFYDPKRSFNLHLLTTDNQWVHFGANQGLAGNAAHTLELLSDGSLFVGTSTGFSIIAPKGDIYNYTNKQGLENQYIYSSAIDKSGRIWMAHQYYEDGVSIFDKDIISRITSAEGLLNDKIEKIAFDDLDRAWLISTNGKVSIYPIKYLDKIKTNKEIDKTKIIKRNIF